MNTSVLICPNLQRDVTKYPAQKSDVTNPEESDDAIQHGTAPW